MTASSEFIKIPSVGKEYLSSFSKWIVYEISSGVTFIILFIYNMFVTVFSINGILSVKENPQK